MQSPSQSFVPEMNVGNVPLQRPLSIAISLSYAQDGEQSAQLFRDQLHTSASSRGLPVDFVFRMVGAPEVQQKMAQPRSVSAEVFVAFLTPRYISERGTVDLEEHLASADEGGLRFGLRCQTEEWQKVPEVRSLRLLPSVGPGIGSSTGSTPDPALIAAVEEFLDTLLDQGVIPAFEMASDGANEARAAEHILQRWTVSPGAQWILDRAAAETAEQRLDLALDTASVLAAMVASDPPNGAPQWTGHWTARELADAYGPLRKRRRSGSGKRYPVEFDPPVSLGLGTALDEAQAIAQKTSAAATIHARHLLAAVLCDPRGTASRALGILADAGYDIAHLRLAFYDFVRGDTDDDEAWGRILLGEITEAPKLSEFHADDSHSEDFLDVRPDVLAFAGLIAARTLKPPLSIASSASGDPGRRSSCACSAGRSTA